MGSEAKENGAGLSAATTDRAKARERVEAQIAEHSTAIRVSVRRVFLCERLWLWGVSVLSALAAFVMLYHAAIGLHMPTETLIAICLVIIGLCLAKPSSSWARNGARKRLAPHRGFICPHCHFPLTGLADAGRCPECSRKYTRLEILSLWKATYDLDEWSRDRDK